MFSCSEDPTSYDADGEVALRVRGWHCCTVSTGFVVTAELRSTGCGWVGEVLHMERVYAVLARQGEGVSGCSTQGCAALEGTVDGRRNGVLRYARPCGRLGGRRSVVA